MKKLYKRRGKNPVKNRINSPANKRKKNRRARLIAENDPFMNGGARPFAEQGVSYLRPPEESLPPGAWQHFWHTWFSPGHGKR